MHDQVDKLDQLKANLVNMVKFVVQKFIEKRGNEEWKLKTNTLKYLHFEVFAKQGLSIPLNYSINMNIPAAMRYNTKNTANKLIMMLAIVGIQSKNLNANAVNKGIINIRRIIVNISAMFLEKVCHFL